MVGSRQELNGRGYCLMQLAWSGETWQLKTAGSIASAAAMGSSSRCSMAVVNGSTSGRNSSGGGGPQPQGVLEEPLLTKVEVERDALAALSDR